MIRIKQLALFLLLPGLPLAAQTEAETPVGEKLLVKMYNKYKKGPCGCYTFSQKNAHYKADTVSGTSVWHERIEFPDRFTIVFGDSAKGNYVVFRNDSSLQYRAGKFIKSKTDSSALLLLLGGMFYRPFDDVLQRLRDAKFDLTKTHEENWNGSVVNVIGAIKGDVTSNQFWIDKKTMRIMRIIQWIGPETMDMRFESHQKWCGGYVETKVSFRRNGKLEQVEEYYNIRECMKK
jgi:hypothetical protein